MRRLAALTLSGFALLVSGVACDRAESGSKSFSAPDYPEENRDSTPSKPAEPKSSSDLERARSFIRQLGSEENELRDQAHVQLRRMGFSAEVALQEASKAEDQEAGARVEKLLLPLQRARALRKGIRSVEDPPGYCVCPSSSGLRIWSTTYDHRIRNQFKDLINQGWFGGPQLLQVVSDTKESVWIRRRAIVLLGALGDARALPTLVRLLWCEDDTYIPGEGFRPLGDAAYTAILEIADLAILVPLLREEMENRPPNKRASRILKNIPGENFRGH